ncbi:hypothetical protein GCM10027612_58530 [Microbispora bryophytorum subsp. camponoti]
MFRHVSFYERHDFVTMLDLGEGTETRAEFALLGLPKPLVAGLTRQGITAPFPIQRAAIPDILAGHDVLGRGQTGSGKTLAFGLPTLTRIAGEKARPGRPRALVLVPTRELALQVADALEPLGRGLSLRTRTVVGGMSMGRQIEDLRRGSTSSSPRPAASSTSSSRASARWTTSRSPSWTRPTTCATSGSCPWSARCWRVLPRTVSACCSPRRSTVTWTRSSSAS